MTTQGEKTRQALKGTNTNEIETGLDHYLRDKRIESLFTGMTENLLLFQPDNPVNLSLDFPFQQLRKHLRTHSNTSEKTLKHLSNRYVFCKDI
mgnify:CR=1 FL=1